MTTLSNRPARASGTGPSGGGFGDDSDHDRYGGRPVVLSALVGTGAVVLGGLLCCLAIAVAGWLGAPLSGVSTAMRVGALGWLVMHHGDVTIPGGEITLAPLGGWLPVLYGLYRAGRFAGRTSVLDTAGDIVKGTTTIIAGYAGSAVLVAVLTSSEAVSVSPVAAGLTTGAMALLAGGAGLVVGGGWAPVLAAGVPELVRRGITAAAWMAGVAAGCGLAVVGILTMLHWDRVVELAAPLRAGTVGTIVLVIVCVLLAPNAAMFALAFMAGPGFHLGAGTTVAADQITLGRLPAFPLFGIIGSPAGDSGHPTWLLAVVPLVAGLAGGVVLVRRAEPVAGERLLAALTPVAIAALAAGAVLGFLMKLSGGALGPGRMADFGAEALPAAALLSPGMALGALLVVGPRWALRRRVEAADAVDVQQTVDRSRPACLQGDR